MDKKFSHQHADERIQTKGINLNFYFIRYQNFKYASRSDYIQVKKDIKKLKKLALIF